jgi:hypothetical protein
VLVDAPGKMTEFQKTGQGQLFLTFLDKDTSVVGMKVKTKTGLDAVFHLYGGEPRIVAPDLFENRDVLALTDVSLRIPPFTQAKGEHPGNKDFGSVILSADGVYIRASNREGTFDVNINTGVAGPHQRHPGSVWFDSWDLVRTRHAEAHVLITHRRTPAEER